MARLAEILMVKPTKVMMTSSGTSGETIMAEPGGVNTGNDGFAVNWINYA